jgi:adenosine deaminase
MRPATLIELARTYSRELPTTNVDDLTSWIQRGAQGGGLVGYLSGFAHVLAVTQHRDALERLVWEAVEDLAADNTVYAELRFAPELHLEAGLSLDDVLECVTNAASRAGATIGVRVNTIACAMRDRSYSSEVAQAALRWRDYGVVALDLAGQEAGHPAKRHHEAFAIARRGELGITVHAGEADGLMSISDAISSCGAGRIGHGVRIIDDITLGPLDDPVLGSLAQLVHERQIPLEICPSSNLHTGAFASLLEHPVDLLRRLGFAVTINADNRTMSDTTTGREIERCRDAYEWSDAVVHALQLTALDAAFLDESDRTAIRQLLL